MKSSNKKKAVKPRLKRLQSAEMVKIVQNRRLTQAMNNSGADT